MSHRTYVSAIVLIGFMLLAAGSGRNDDKSPEQKAQDLCEDKRMAFVISQLFVKDRLKSPSSAIFPATSQVKINYFGDCRHAVYGYVDAQNSFGAMLRTKYYAEVQYKKSTDKWLLLDFSLDD